MRAGERDSISLRTLQGDSERQATHILPNINHSHASASSSIIPVTNSRSSVNFSSALSCVSSSSMTVRARKTRLATTLKPPKTQSQSQRGAT